MPAWVGRLDGEVLIDLLGCFHVEGEALAVLVELAENPFVERQAGIDPVLVCRRQPLGAVEYALGLLAAGQGQLDRMLRAVAFRLVADHQVGEDGGFALVVGHAAAVELTVFLIERERIAGPVLAFGLDDVEVGHQQDRLGLGIAAGKGGDDAAVLGGTVRREHMDIGV